MKEIQDILQKVASLGADETAILATVVDVVGSGYRRPGARMLIDADGYAVGTVSGGCLEADVLERAKAVIATGEAAVITYDTTKDEDSVFGLGMGCRGIVRILLEKISRDDEFVGFVATRLRERRALRVVTLIDGNAALRPGVRVAGDGHLDAAVNGFGDAETNEINALELTAGTARLSFGEVFVETIAPAINLLIFGVGHDALPLVTLAKTLGWRVTAIDHRPAFANTARLPLADEVIHASIADVPDALFQDEHSVAVVMTHNFERDRAILPRLLGSKCVYVGALGPRKRTEKILAENTHLSDDQLARLYAPVGLDLGADTPESIALAVVAEIQAVLNGRRGGFLRERQGPIYGRSTAA